MIYNDEDEQSKGASKSAAAGYRMNRSSDSTANLGGIRSEPGIPSQGCDRVVELLRDAREQQLVQAEKLAAVGGLIASVAHEINNPLAVMLCHLDLAIRELGPIAWSVRSEVDVVIQQIRRVQKIVDSLLYIAGPAEDLESLNPEKMGTTVQESVRLVLDQARHKDVDVRTNLQAKTTVLIGRQDLQQVIVNLLANALHAIETGSGLIEVTSRDLEDGRGIVIGVRDTGSGVPPQFVNDIFKPFFTTKGAGKGSGLGLAVSNSLIRRYGGSLRLAGTSEHGTEFRIVVLSQPVLSDAESWLAQSLATTLEVGAEPRIR